MLTVMLLLVVMDIVVVLLLLLLVYGGSLLKVVVLLLVLSFSMRHRVGGRRAFRQRHAHVTYLQTLAGQPVFGQRLGRAPRRPTPAEHEVRVFRAALHFHLLRFARRRRRRRRRSLFVITDHLRTHKKITILIYYI